MKYEIEMIDVKAADAFLIHYVEDNGESHIIMVDSGNYDDADKILTHIRTHYDKVKKSGWSGYVIDAAIVTHPDDDHIGGFVHILEIYKQENCMISALIAFGLMTQRSMSLYLMTFKESKLKSH